ncbi:MAG: pentapeptide repeat-containing protein [Anaerolineae bacterium]|nr:pentapeptide repeat-containing protein [Anaerolineae bacterium]
MPQEIQSGTTYTDEFFEALDAEGGQISSCEFYDCRFERCSFVEAAFLDCRFVNCQFQHCDLSMMNIEGSSFSSTQFEHSKVLGIDWTRGAWPEIQVKGPLVFKECVLTHSTFIGLAMKEAQYLACVARNVDFREATLAKADFSDTDLSGSHFINTDLREADFRSAYNYQINPAQNKIDKAKFTLPEAMSLLYSLDIVLDEGNSSEGER